MEAASILTSTSSLSSNHRFTFDLTTYSLSSVNSRLAFPKAFTIDSTRLCVENDSVLFRRRAVESSGSVIEEEEEVVAGTTPLVWEKDAFPKVDKAGRFCSPGSARELALSMIYTSCLEGADPVRLFDKRANGRRRKMPGYEFDKNALLKYNHMIFGGAPVTVETVEDADDLLHVDEMESAIEAEVLSAPPKFVYSKLILRFARKLLVAVVEKWDAHVLVINKVVPANWKAVDLAKRFCDGAAPRIINGCLRTYVKDHGEPRVPKVVIESSKELV